MISFSSSLEIVNVARFAKFKGRVPDPNIALWRAASVADAAVHPYGIKLVLANGLSTSKAIHF